MLLNHTMGTQVSMSNHRADSVNKIEWRRKNYPNMSQLINGLNSIDIHVTSANLQIYIWNFYRFVTSLESRNNIHFTNLNYNSQLGQNRK